MKQRATVVLVIAVLLLGLVIPLCHPATASADVTSDDVTSGNATYNFQDRAHIVASFGSDGQTTFTDSDDDDGTNVYTPDDQSLFCKGFDGTEIKLSGSSTQWSNITVSGTLVYELTAGATCGPTKSQPITISNTSLQANSKYEWDGNNITTLPAQKDSATFVPETNNSAPSTLYYDSSAYSAYDQCSKSAVVLNQAGSSDGTLYCLFTPSQSDPGAGRFGPNGALCTSSQKTPSIISTYISGSLCLSKSMPISILGMQGSTQPGSTAPSGGSGTPSLGCHIGIGIFNPLNWLLCGAILGMSAIIGVLDRAISSQLAIGTDNSNGAATDIFGDSSGQCTASAQQSCNDYYNAWSSFRNIALGLMVLGGLIMLIAQALGFEVLDAYTIRKVLPRLLIAAVGITLSWPLMNFFVTLSNDLGYGVRSLIIYPFSHSGFTHDDINLASFGAQGTSLLAVMGGIAFGAFGLLLFAASGALALIIAFFVLILRQIAVILLIILAPIAIVSYILPNTQNLFKLWWDSFSKALMMFPLIEAFIAAGHVFSYIAAQNANNIFDQIAAFVAYFAPYFLIPATFKLAGGALRQIGGFVNDRGRGGFDQLRGARNRKLASNVQKIRSGQRWDENWGRIGNTSVGHIANRAAINLFDQDELAPYRIGKTKYGKYLFGKQSAGLEGKVDNAVREQSEKGLQETENLGLGREAYSALAKDYSGFDKARITTGDNQGKLVSDVLDSRFQGRAASSLADYNFMEETLKNSDDTKLVEAGDDIGRAKGYLANLKGDPEMTMADSQAIGVMGMAAAGYGGTAEDFSTAGNSLRDRLGNGGALVFNRAQRMAAQKRPDLRDRYGVTAAREVGPDGREKMVYKSSYADKYSDAATGAIITTKGTDWSQAKGEAVREVAPTFTAVADGSAVTHWTNRANELAAAGDNNGATSAYNQAKKLSDQRDNIRGVIAYNVANPYSDPGAQAEWQKIAASARLSEAELRRGQASLQNDDAAKLRSGGGDGGNPAAPGGAAPAAP
jgi:hypothetical protein